MLIWIFYATTVQMIWIILPRFPLPTSPVAALDPFRIANRYGLFAVMTRGRWEIEFQGSNDGQNWVAYPFRYKPQDLGKPPGIYAPYQPRFDWNLWFASLGSWRENMDRAQHRRAFAGWLTRCAGAICRKPVPSSPAAADARRALAVLVHHASGEARHWNVVEAKADRTVCPSAGAASRRQSWRCAMAGTATAAAITLVCRNASYSKES